MLWPRSHHRGCFVDQTRVVRAMKAQDNLRQDATCKVKDEIKDQLAAALRARACFSLG